MSSSKNPNTFNSRSTLKVGGREFLIYRLDRLSEAGLGDVSRLPFTLKVVLENLLRCEDGEAVTAQEIRALARGSGSEGKVSEIAFHPARVLLQDFTGIPVIADLAAMRDALKDLGGDPDKVNPNQPVDLVIDHSVQVDHFGSGDAFKRNTEIETQRNRERYTFLRWGQQAFKNFRVVPPGTGIVHQVNLEYLAPVVFTRREDGMDLAYPDTLVGTDSHTTMINGLGVLGWGVGGIEAEAAMLGQPITMQVPQVVGFKLTGRLPEGSTATDLVLTVTELLRSKGVVGKYVEFFGPGLKALTLPDRATISNMCPEYGATVGFFPVDEKTLEYLALTARDKSQVDLVRAYTQAQGLFAVSGAPDPVFSDVVTLDLGTVEPSLAGPRRPQDRIALSGAKTAFRTSLAAERKGEEETKIEVRSNGGRFDIRHGSVVIAAITSCTNTSNPSVMVGAGLLAKKAVERGLSAQPWVKTSLAPGSQVVMDYLNKTGLLRYLEALRFHLVGFGCTTCIGNSGPLPEPIGKAVKEGNLIAAAVLSGNRNFEGRINPLVRYSYLASPPLVVAYAIAGTIDLDLVKDPIGKDKKGRDVFLKDIWPAPQEVESALKSINARMYQARYESVFKGDASWRSLKIPKDKTFKWQPSSTYVRRPSFLEGIGREPEPVKDIEGARVLALLGDSVTTDHISPAGAISADGPAGRYLVEQGVNPTDFNSFGSRRGNHEVMVRGTFGNIRLRNLLAPWTEGGWTVHQPSGDEMWIYEAACRYRKEGVSLIILAGKEYGSGSSRDWAAKGPQLLGVRAVIAESYERIHRSNLVGMGILPLQFREGENVRSLGLSGQEAFSIGGISTGLEPGQELTVTTRAKGGGRNFKVISRIDTLKEIAYYRHGGILPYVLRQLAE